MRRRSNKYVLLTKGRSQLLSRQMVGELELGKDSAIGLGQAEAFGQMTAICPLQGLHPQSIAFPHQGGMALEQTAA
ncbi:hypothetical protein D3C76_1043070 [compost metagenome]